MTHRATVQLGRDDWEVIVDLLRSEVDLLDDASDRVEDEVDTHEWTKWSILAQQYRQLLESLESQLARGPAVSEDSHGWLMIRQLLEAEAGKQQMISIFGEAKSGGPGEGQSALDPLIGRLMGCLEAQGWSSH
jgi:hypothetical protein